ncbi:filamin-A-interacting protein 1-like [Engraulis encrasicolus]|uniref:filamin-A-interacting protein 1-like n=1 Tax=Engraulis encrasicolus TaxID=184585 RepID=UPI002FD03857
MRSKNKAGTESQTNGVLVVPCGPNDIAQEEPSKGNAPSKSKRHKSKQKNANAEKEISGNEEKIEEKTEEKPIENGDEPIENGDQPIENGGLPTENGDQPTGNGDQSIENGVQPTVNGDQPIENGNQPSLGLKDLSKEDLLALLGVMEGEVQAREDVIRVLHSQQGGAGPSTAATAATAAGAEAVLEARYGSADPTKALQALQRDALLVPSKQRGDVYEKPMAALDRLQDKHKEAYRRMLEQLLLVEKCHRRTLHELDTEKRKHADYMNKSDDFTNLLEQERERLKKLLETEKAYQVRKDKENTKRLEKVRDELVKLKSFALMLVDERQLHLEQIDQQNQKAKELTENLQEKESKLNEAGNLAKEESQKVLTLEAALESKSTQFAKEHEDMTAKLTSQESQNKQLRQKVAGLTSQIQALEEANGALQRSAEELQELRDKISQGEYGNSNLMAELEKLRKRVLEMEGKDEEITKTETHCRELQNKLLEEESQGKELKLEVERLQGRMSELDKLEDSFNLSRTDCAQLQSALEKERGQSKELADELVLLKIRVKELESSELRLEKAELLLKDDLMKLKSVTVVMFNERKNLTERIRYEEKKREELSIMFKAEQEKVMEVTERLIEESKKLLKFKSEMEAKLTSLTRERDELVFKLGTEEERNKELSTKVCILKQKIGGLEGVEKESAKYMLKQESGRLSEERGQDEAKIKELNTEIERLKNRLKQLEVVEGDLIKTEDEYDMLEKRFKTEQDKANTLFLQVEEMKSQIAFNKAIERGEAVIQEAELRQRCMAEEAKTRDLELDVLALKEKIHELMNKEDLLSQLQVDYSVLQQRFLEEEDKKKSISNEVLNLTKELEVTKRYSRALRPSTNGRRMVDVPMTSTAVQTDPATNETTEEDTPAVFIKKSVQEENHVMSNLRQRCLKKSTERTTVERYPSDMRKSWIPWMRKKDNSHNGSEKPMQVNGECSPAELSLTQKQGQPLHIRVTPDHQNSQATLEISSPSTSDIYSTTTVIPNTPGLQKPRITIIPTPSLTPTKNRTIDSPRVLERAKSPVTITTISRAKSPEIRIPVSDRSLSPVSIMSVSTSSLSDMSSSPEPHEMITGRAVFKVTPEKQMVPAPIKKFGSSNANIVTTEDNKIHIHLGSQFKRPLESNSSSSSSLMVGGIRPPAEAADSKEMSTGTVLRSPRQSCLSPTKPSANKVTSSITITPVCSNAPPARPTLTVQAPQDMLSPKSGASRIPMSRGMKTGKAVLGALGISSTMKMEARADGQSMRIELKKSTLSGASFLSGGKS